MDIKVAYLHGIGGANAREEWLSALNHELARAGYERLHPSEVVDFDYSKILDGVVGRGLHEPPITLFPARRREEGAQGDYFDNLRRFRSHVAAEGARSSWMQAAPPRIAEAASQFLPQVENYRSNRDVRAAVWAHVLAGLPARGKVVLVGHSLGSVIAADIACRVPETLEISALVTVASPLGGIPDLRKGSTLLAATGAFPYERVRMWVNVYSPNDIVTVGRGIARSYPMALDVPVETGSTWNMPPIENHGIALHAGHPAVAQAVGWATFGDPAPAAPERLPAVQLEAMWEWHFMAFAYANALLGAIPAKQAQRRNKLRLAMEECARRVEEQGRSACGELERLAEQATGADEDRIQELLQRAGRHPTAQMLMDRSVGQLQDRYPTEDLPSFAVALLHGLPLPPFDVEEDRSEERVQALTAVLEQTRKKRSVDPPSPFLASAAKDALVEAEKVMGIERGGWVKWAALSAVGIGVVVGTVITAGAMAPAGLAGAAAITAALAAFGPGGMVGGIATIAALTGAGAATAAAGGLAAAVESWEDQERRRFERRAEIRAAIAELAAALEPQQLRSSLAAFIAAVIVQEKASLPTARMEVFLSVQQVLAALRSDLAVAAGIDKKSGYAKALYAKVKILERAADWLGSVTGGGGPSGLSVTVPAVKTALGKTPQGHAEAKLEADDSASRDGLR